MARSGPTWTLISVAALALGAAAGCRHGGPHVATSGCPRPLLGRICGSGSCDSTGDGCRAGDCPSCPTGTCAPRGILHLRPKPVPAHPDQGNHHDAPPPPLSMRSKAAPAVLEMPQHDGVPEVGHSVMNDGVAGAKAALTSGLRSHEPWEYAAVRRERPDEFDERWFAETPDDGIEPWPYHGLSTGPTERPGYDADGMPEAYPHAPETQALEVPQPFSSDVEAPPMLFAPPAEAPELRSADKGLPLITPGPTARR